MWYKSMVMRIADKRDFGDSYLDARIRLDRLCGKIIEYRIVSNEAFEEYDSIESDFLKEDVEKTELFKMIYKHRIKRLVGQFPAGESV